MTNPSEAITLYGERAERFREIQMEISDGLGYEPSNAETVGLIMSKWDKTDKNNLI